MQFSSSKNYKYLKLEKNWKNIRNQVSMLKQGIIHLELGAVVQYAVE